ncbi:MAG: serine/threonine protein kinase [Planctomycetaceae bacterium]|nr:serine/threonine protein kinase [Planctomycetaceae bacterium]
MVRATACPPPETLNRWSTGLINGDEFEILSQHIECCADCQQQIRSSECADAFIHELSQIPAEIWDSGGCDVTAPVGSTALAHEDAERVRIGDCIGQYRLESLISRGGMGFVFRAKHTELLRTVALKVLPFAPPDTLSQESRFRLEWRSMGRITDARIVQPTDAGEDRGCLFLAMEFLDGVDLGKIVHRTGRMKVTHAAAVGVQAAEGLNAVHAAGLIHRDVKPTNLMVQTDGTLRILDLGLAISVHASQSITGATDLGQFVGTAEFVAPEQIESSRNVNFRTDQYSLGCTLYFLLTGRPPFPVDNVDCIRKVLSGHLLNDPPTLDSLRDDLPDGLSEVIHRALARDPRDRFNSMQDLADALRPFAESDGLTDIVQAAIAAAPDMPQPAYFFRLPVRHTSLDPVEVRKPESRTWLGGLLVAAILVPLWAIAFNSSVKPDASLSSNDGRRTLPESSTKDLPAAADFSQPSNLFVTTGPHAGYSADDGHPLAPDDEVVIQLDTKASSEREVHYLEAKPGTQTVRFRPDRGGLLKAGLIEIPRFVSRIKDDVDLTGDVHPVKHDVVLTAAAPSATLEITPGTHKQGFIPVHVDRSSGVPMWTEAEGLQAHSFVYYCYPDLTFENAAVPSLVVKSGQLLELRLDVYNRGTAAAAAGKVACGVQQHGGVIANNASVFVDYPALVAGQRASLTIPVRLPRRKVAGVWYLTFRIDATNTTHPERDELPPGNWEVRDDEFLVLAFDEHHVPPNNSGMFRLEVRP